MWGAKGKVTYVGSAWIAVGRYPVHPALCTMKWLLVSCVCFHASDSCMAVAYTYVCMYVWLYVWMDGWMYRWMDEWIDGWMDEWMDGYMDGWMDGCTPCRFLCFLQYLIWLYNAVSCSNA